MTDKSTNWIRGVSPTVDVPFQPYINQLLRFYKVTLRDKGVDTTHLSQTCALGQAKAGWIWHQKILPYRFRPYYFFFVCKFPHGMKGFEYNAVTYWLDAWCFPFFSLFLYSRLVGSFCKPCHSGSEVLSFECVKYLNSY